ncbi:MAG: serine hydrolase domain-containing protein, partial [Pseudomonadota bacterium]
MQTTQLFVRASLTLVLAFSLFVQVSVGQMLTDEKRTELLAYIDGLGSSDAPGIGAGIVRDGEIVFEHYIGLANLEHGIPISSDTRFNIASNAKQYTALMVLDLAEKGKVDLKADFRMYLPDAMPEIDETVTIEQLISHTSGIRDVYDLWGMTGVTWYERPYRNRDAMKLLNRQADLNFAPGSREKYSNSNYILLAELISEVSGEKYSEYANAFFEARNMLDTMTISRHGRIIPKHAPGYGNWSGWIETISIANTAGDGFLYTTLSDQLQWEQQVQGINQTLPAELIERSQSPVSDALTTEYGFGLEFGGYKGLDFTFHAGSTGGANAYLMRFPAQKTSIIVIGNTTEIGVAQTARKLADIVLSDQIGTAVNKRKPEQVSPPPASASLV